jgi:hypothetical protein
MAEQTCTKRIKVANHPSWRTTLSQKSTTKFMKISDSQLPSYRHVFHKFHVHFSMKCGRETAMSLSLCKMGALARPWTQHYCHHDTKVKPEAATAVIELLMMGEKTPETCWAVNKRQVNKLKNCCIRSVIYLNCTMMHEPTNLKFYI